MKIRYKLLAAAALFVSIQAIAADGLVAVKSPLKAKATMDRFEMIVKDKGLNVFARIDHAAGAMKVGKTLRPTDRSKALAGFVQATVTP